MANEDGVWRTVGGRRIFIKDGQSLSDAMKNSGKFKKGAKYKNKTGGEIEIDDYTKDKQPQYKQNGEVKKAHDDESLNKILKDNGYEEEKSSNKYTDKQLEMVWENEDSTEVYNHLTKDEKAKMKLAEKDAYDGNESARQYVEKMNDEAAKRFLDAHKNDSDYEGYFMKDKDVASENKKMDINDQKYNIEKSSGLKVEKAFETDAYGTGKEDRFKLEDGRYVAHSYEDDSWSINKVEGGKINSKDFKSYDDMLDHLKGGSSDSNKEYIKTGDKNLKTRDDAYRQAAKELGYKRHTSDYKQSEEIYNRAQEIIERNPQIKEYENFKENAYKEAAKELGYKRHTSDERQSREIYERAQEKIKKYDKQEGKLSNSAYKKAFEDYKKKHPNSKISLNQFIDMSEGK